MNLKKIYAKLTAKECAFIAIFFWATAFVLTKVVLKEVDVTTLGVLRYFFASIIVIFILIKQKISLPKLKKISIFFVKRKKLLQADDKNHQFATAHFFNN